jgi:hypothetical protein
MEMRGENALEVLCFPKYDVLLRSCHTCQHKDLCFELLPQGSSKMIVLLNVDGKGCSWFLKYCGLPYVELYALSFDFSKELLTTKIAGEVKLI